MTRSPPNHLQVYKKPKKVLEEEEEVIKRGLDLIERGLEHLVEKITSTGVQGLGIGYATPDESPRGPTTQNIRDNTMPDFDPQARSDDELKPATAKKPSDCEPIKVK